MLVILQQMAHDLGRKPIIQKELINQSNDQDAKSHDAATRIPLGLLLLSMLVNNLTMTIAIAVAAIATVIEEPDHGSVSNSYSKSDISGSN